MKILSKLILLAALIGTALGQGPHTPPTGYVQPIGMTGMGPNGLFATMGVDSSGNLNVTGSPSGIFAQITGYVQPYAPVAQDSSGNWQYLAVDASGNLKTSGSGGGVSITTVAGLSSIVGATKGTIAVVTDGNTTSDCTVGTGTNVVTCQYNGTTWGQLAAASSGATAFSAITGATNTNALVMGTGGSLTTSGTGTINANQVNGAVVPTSAGVLASNGSKQLIAVTTTGSGNAVLATGPTLSAPVLGTPLSVTLTNATGLPISTGVSGLGTGVATFLGTPSSANLASVITDEIGSGKAVFATALQGTDVNVLTSGTISGTGATLCTDALGGATTSSCAPTFTPKTNTVNNTALTGVDFTTSTANSVGLTVTPSNPSGIVEKFEITGGTYTGNAANITGTAAIANGGTGQITAGAAFNALAPATATGGLIVGTGSNTYGNVAVGSIGSCLTSNGTTAVWGSCATGSIGGSGTANTVTKFTAAATVGNSAITDNATQMAYSGTGGLLLSAGPLVMTQIVAPTGSAGSSWLWADSVTLRWEMKNGSNTAANVVASGVDINTSDQVTVTHLAAALPVNQGGTGTTSTLTGIMRGSASAFTAAELSADATTSGSNAVTVVALRGATLPTLAASTGLLFDTAGTLSLPSTLPTSAEPAHTGDATNSSGALAMTVVALRNAALPTLAASTGLLFDTAGTLSLPSTLPTSAVPAFTGDMTNSGGSLATTVSKINNTSFTGTNGDLVKFGAANTPADSSIVAADVITYHTPATGIARTASGSQAIVGTELSGDATTSGSNAVTVVKINGNTVPSGATVHQVAVATATSVLTWKTLPDCNGSSNALNYTQSTDLFSCLSIATLTNPMTTLGDIIYGGSAGAVSRLAGATTPTGVTLILTSTNSGGVAQAPQWALAGVPVNTQSGATYTTLVTDRVSLINTTNNTTSTAVSVSDPATTGFTSNFAFVLMNSGTVVVTATPAGSKTVNGDATLKLVGNVATHTPEACFFYSDNTNWFAPCMLPVDANGRLGAEGFGALTGDVTNSAGSYATTVGGINGTAFSGTTGHAVSFGAANTPADSGVVVANIVTASGTLTSTAIMTGAGTKTVQTPSTTTTLDASGNLQLAAGGSLSSADTGTPTFLFAANKVALSKPIALNSTSNQMATGTGANLTTLNFPASSGGVTLTFPITTELMVGVNSDTTTTHIAHATAVAGIASFAALACGDLPALTGDATTSAGSCATTVVKINGTAFSGVANDVVAFGAGGTIPLDTSVLYTNLVTAASNYTSAGLLYAAGANKTTTNSADWAISTHTLSGGSLGILDIHAISATAGFLPPSAAGAVPTTSGVVSFDSTAKDVVWGNGTNTSQAGFFTGAPTGSLCVKTSGTTGLLVEASCSGGGTVTSVGLVGTANQVTVTGASPITASGSWTLSIPSALSLGTDNTTAGTVQLANGSAAAHTIWGSGATTTNTINGFAAVPTTGHLIDCTVTTTTCLMHDSGVVTTNVVNASSPGVGIAHFAGSTQTVTSSLIVAADITSATITHTQTDATFPTIASPTFTGTVTLPLLVTTTRCAAAGSAANPSAVACSAAMSGSFSCATNASTGTCVVSTTAVTANSAIFIQPDSSLGTLLSVTCNTTADTGLTAPRVSARSAGTSFTITLGTYATNPLCYSYMIVN